MQDDNAGERPSPRVRRTTALLLVVGTLAVAVGGAILTEESGQLNLWIEQLAGRSRGGVRDVGSVVPLGFAFVAGMVTAFNPCGFPLLPAYLGFFLSDERGDGGTALRRLGRSVVVGTTVTVAFMLLFAAVGFAIAAGAGAIVDAIPWVALGLGALLVMVGGYLLAGGSLYSSVPEQLGARVGGGRGMSGYFLFGLAYGLASLSCTLPIFLAVLATAVTGTITAQLGAVLLFGLGMGLVIMVLTIATGLFRTAVAAHMSAVVRQVNWIGVAALFIAGAYLVYYWLTIGGLLAS